jgi:uracil phosphoribosyltransferase
VLLEKGADIKKMYFFNVVSCPEGLQRLQTTFPDLTIVMGALDEKLNEKV